MNTDYADLTDKERESDRDQADKVLAERDAEIAALRQQVAELQATIDEATTIAAMYGQTDGDHHKLWVIDQMVRVLEGSNYEQFVRVACNGEDGPNTYQWDVGIAP